MTMWRRPYAEKYWAGYILNGVRCPKLIYLGDKFKIVNCILGEAMRRFRVGDTLSVFATDSKGETVFEGDFILGEGIKYRIFNYKPVAQSQ